MDEDKAQRLHDTLAKLKPKGRGGLGLGGGYNFPGSKANGGHVTTATRKDGLPNNALYSNFVREGSLDLDQLSRNPFGDGRVIKRNFDDCQSSSDCDDGGNGHDKRKKLRRKELSKEEKKAAKKEAKRRAKFEAKKAAKLEEKRAAKLAEKVRRKQAEGQSANGGAEDLVVKNGTVNHKNHSEDEGKKKTGKQRRGSEEYGQEMGCTAVVSSTDGCEEVDSRGTETKKKKKKDKGRKRNRQNDSVDHAGSNGRVSLASRDIPVTENGNSGTKKTADEDHSEKSNNGRHKLPEKGKKLKKKKKRKRDADSTTSTEKLTLENERKKAKKKKKR